ncbi:hypothetical protein CWE21_11110 [Pseudidiomarina aquimaris]|uniref:Uncharacterized protein n=1 Tax=Pseudidiomarina aquimaris TaxID=641841 RepID=A0A432XC46_9GAMM|nr:hypothetical protein CWE21_11110 [Pseudidiomarina aquimaris]
MARRKKPKLGRAARKKSKRAARKGIMPSLLSRKKRPKKEKPLNRGACGFIEGCRVPQSNIRWATTK